MDVPQHVLIADDDLTSAELMGSWFQTAGFHVSHAANGMVAWQLLSEQSPDVVVTDYEMPLLGGNQLCAAIRSDSRNAKLPIVMVTGSKREMDLSWLQSEYDLAAIFIKPCGMSQLIEAVQRSTGMAIAEN